MSFLAPGFLYAAMAVAAAIVALHFIVTRQPRSSILPTARFVPDTRATTVASAPRPSDLLPMMLRVLTVLAAGAALAKPVLTPSRRAEARVILVDVSRSAIDSTAMRDGARKVYRDGDGLVLFDSSARVIAGNPRDTLGALRPTSRRGNLSAAFIAALRAGSSLRDRADSLELVVISPFAKEELDAATDSIRKLWPGRARLLSIGGQASDTLGRTDNLQMTADASDPLAITAALARNDVKSAALISRLSGGGTQSGAPSSSAPLIEWPVSERPPGAIPRASVDIVGGVSTGTARVIAAFERRWSYPPDSLRRATVIARWVDGEPAAIERASGAACIRSVAIPVTSVGDLVIRKDFVAFVTDLSRACAQVTALIPADPSAVARLTGSGGLAPRTAFQPRTDSRSLLAPWLLVLAIAAAVAELFVRRRARESATAERASSAREVKAA